MAIHLSVVGLRTIKESNELNSKLRPYFDLISLCYSLEIPQAYIFEMSIKIASSQHDNRYIFTNKKRYCIFEVGLFNIDIFRLIEAPFNEKNRQILDIIHNTFIELCNLKSWELTVAVKAYNNIIQDNFYCSFFLLKGKKVRLPNKKSLQIEAVFTIESIEISLLIYHSQNDTHLETLNLFKLHPRQDSPDLLVEKIKVTKDEILIEGQRLTGIKTHINLVSKAVRVYYFSKRDLEHFFIVDNKFSNAEFSLVN